MKTSYWIILATLTVVIFIALQSFKTNPTPMLHFDKDDYEAEWAAIDSLERDGLPQSALEKVEALYEKAKKEENAPQYVKTVVYKAKYKKLVEEEGEVLAVQLIEKEINEAQFPVKQILQSALAEQYKKYLDDNYWRFQDRSNITEVAADDMRTWTVEQFIDKTNALYWQSLDEQRLKQVPVEEFEAILRKGKESQGLRPTLYDLLAYRAVDYFMDDRSYLTEPANKFYLDNASMLADATTFARTAFATTDSASFKFQTLLLLQDLIQFHLDDEKPDALIDADLKRLKFVHQNGILSAKNELYLKRLDELIAKHQKHPMASEVLYAKASYYEQQGRDYNIKKGDKYQWDWKTAVEICEETIENYPDAYGTKLCAQLKQGIESESVNVQSEQVNLPEQPFLLNVQYKNIEQLYFKVVPFEYDNWLTLMREQYDQQLEKLNKYKARTKWSIELPKVGDYRTHSTEVMVESLPLGSYVIVSSDNPDFEGGESSVNVLFTTVSNLGYWHRKNQGVSEFTVMNRQTGEPLENVTVEFLSQNYNRLTRKNNLKTFKTEKTDKNGFATITADQRYFQTRFKYGKDELYLGDGFSNYSYREQERSQVLTHFFLDRAIYRPGQTVHFKALVLTKDNDDKPSILPNEKVTISFHDANYQEVENVQLTTNEYGTVQGTFTAPTGGLLGQMHLKSSMGNSSKFFSVEEYKRPKFAVEFQPVQESYKLEDVVTVKGNAKAFAGNNIDGAKVQYRVARETRFPWMPWWWRRYYQNEASMEITNGETTTDADGNFSIDFKAIPDQAADPENKPEFSYTVYADVTDITGETHSNSTSVSVGYIALNVEVSIPEKVAVSDLRDIKIISKNLNGEFEAARGTVTIQALKTPEQPFIQRYWDAPDQPLLTESQFKKNFPNLPYQDENEIRNWETDKTVEEFQFNTLLKRLNAVNLQPGSYALTLRTADKYGQKVTLNKYFTVYDTEKESMPFAEMGWEMLDKESYEPSETATLRVGTAASNLNMLFELERDQEIVQRKWVAIEEVAQLSIPIQEEDRGNIFYHLSYVKHNRSVNKTNRITVPWSNKDLKIEYSTFRDKLKPGQEEEWQIKISGAKGEQVAAEMVATLYDASLDQFVVNNWQFSPYPINYSTRMGWSPLHFNSTNARQMSGYGGQNIFYDQRVYSGFNWFGLSDNNWMYRTLRGRASGMVVEEMQMMKSANVEMSMDDAASMSASPPPPVEEDNLETYSAGNWDISPSKGGNNAADESVEESAEIDFSNVQVRKNLEETVFFMPNLKTDEEGNVIISFTMNEALTKWKFLGFAHTKDLKFGVTQNETVTQKELMVQPNAPRFMREDDEIVFTAKVSNLTENVMNGNAQIELLDATTMQPVADLFGLKNTQLSFTAEAGQSARLAWSLKVPSVAKVPALLHRVVAQAGDFSDGEENALPILTNRMLVTETMPLPIRGRKQETFTFASLKDANASNTLEHQSLTLEFTSNPAWYAVQALPYLMEYPHDCIEQVFSRYYANSLATSVANAHPRIKEVFDIWATTDAGAMQSNLSKNQELKYALLEETPWVLNAQSEEEQKRNIGLLFDLNRMAKEQATALEKIIERQSPNGGFAWFPGGKESWYMTQYILEGLGHLDRLGVKSINDDARVVRLIDNAVQFIDEQLIDYYNELKRRKVDMDKDNLSPIVIHYLYTRSFFMNYPIEGDLKKVVKTFLQQTDDYWLNKGIYQEGMITLALHRMDESPKTIKKIIKSLKERSIRNKERGMYWKLDAGYYWYQLPIESHALMIEVFDEVAEDEKIVEELKVWLLKAKQATHWKTTKSTAAAVYALLMNGDNWLLEDDLVEVNFNNAGNPEIHAEKIQAAQQNAEVGTGYFKATWSSDEISADMASVQVSNPNKTVAWGGVYWQYFEQLDKIKTFEETPLQLKKQLFKEINTPTGTKLEPIADESTLKPGDKLKVRIELRVDRAMEYVHMKDARASGFEPINVLSKYKWQGGLGYYESTRDASTNFFFSYLPPGTHVFEYPLRVVHEGNFSNGITTIQCMYAPEFTSHSEGIRVEVE